MTAFFDTNPFSDQVGTGGGAWSVYPYFESGNIAISTQSHFFMVVPRTRRRGRGAVVEPEVNPPSREGQVRLRSSRAEGPGVDAYIRPTGHASRRLVHFPNGRMARGYVRAQDGLGSSEAFLVR